MESFYLLLLQHRSVFLIELETKLVYQILKTTAKLIFRDNMKVLENQSVYKRPIVYPKACLGSVMKRNGFCSPSDVDYLEIMSTSYEGFVMDPEETYDEQFHHQFRVAFEGLELQNLYQFDFTQPAGLGTKVVKTFVSRCLVGEPGITYKYLGLRMFSIPWTRGETGSSKYSVLIGQLNRIISHRSAILLRNLRRNRTGSCDYNLTLINRFARIRLKV